MRLAHQLAESTAAASSVAARLSPEMAIEQLAASGWVQFHPALAERLGSFKAAVFLGHALYWTRHLALRYPDRAGWWYMTAQQCQQATALTAGEQSSVRQQLVAHGVLSESLAGRPAKLHYKLNLPVLAGWIGLQADDEGGSLISWEAFAPWLRGCVSFYRPLADLAGSLAAGLYLSHLLQCQRQAVLSGTAVTGGFFRITQDDIRIALCLGSKVQRNARERLRSLGLVQERAGYVQVNLAAIMAHLGQGAQPKASPPQKLRLVQDGPQKAHAQANPEAVASGADRTDGRLQISRWLGPTGPNATKRQQSLFGRWLASSDPDAATAIAQVRRMFLAPSDAGAGLVQTRQAWADAPSGEPCQPFTLLSKLESALSSKPGPQVAQNAKLAGPFVETNLPFCRNQIKEDKNYKKTTTTARASTQASSFNETAGRRRNHEDPLPTLRPQVNADAMQPAPERDDPADQDPQLSSLILPYRLPRQWHAGVLRTVSCAPVAVRQRLLDELEGQLGMEGKTIANPVGYLHALVRRHAKGDLALALADKVSSDRVHRERLAQAVKAAEASGSTTGPMPEPRAEPKESPPAEVLEKLRQLRQEFRARTSGGVAK